MLVSTSLGRIWWSSLHCSTARCTTVMRINDIGIFCIYLSFLLGLQVLNMHQLFSSLICCFTLFQGIIRRVTDSFTGLFSASWLSGWMGGEEEEESGDPQSGPSQASTLAPPGESFIFAHPVTARRSFRPFYPEEGKQSKPLGWMCLLKARSSVLHPPWSHSCM